MNTRIHSFNDLKERKKFLKTEIKNQETNFVNSPVFNIFSSFNKNRSFKNSVKYSMGNLSIDDYKKAAEKIIGTYLMANRKTRKFFVAYIIAKGMVPFTVQKVNEYLRK